MTSASNIPANGANALLHELSLRDATAIVAGTVIGSGIFLVPNSVAIQLSSFAAVLMVWLVGGLLSLFGALALGELGAAFPGAGGLYVYLRHAYGKPVGFLYGWGLLTLIHSGSIATLAVAFRIYLAQMFPLTAFQQKSAGIICVLALTAVNCFGVRSGKGVQNLFTLAKFGGLALMIGILFLWGHSGLLAAAFLPALPLKLQPVQFGIALVAVLWAYEGWHVVSFTAGEFKNAQRDLPRGLFYGTLLVAITYISINIAYYCVLTPRQIQNTERVAATAVSSVLGPTAALFVTILILVSIIGSTNGMILTGPRVYYAMAQEGLFFQAFGKLSSRFRAPVLAIAIQGIWAACLTLLGTFQELFTYVIFTAWIFYGLAVAGVIVMRIRRPDIPRPFLAPGYPWLPALFTLAALGITLSAVISSPLHALYGIGLILSGLPFYAIFLSRTRIQEPPTSVEPSGNTLR
ncbi:MAG TPA: amino acid permease [Candidatus Acidoferrales bacterium]|nr:amino acid permease [Candidatus Acidoferrales bacterium]